MKNWKHLETKQVNVNGVTFHGDFHFTDNENEPYIESSKFTFRGDNGETFVSVSAAALDNYNKLCDGMKPFNSLLIVEEFGVKNNIAIIQAIDGGYHNVENLVIPEVSQETLCAAYQKLN
jgi:hypothetical protein